MKTILAEAASQSPSPQPTHLPAAGNFGGDLGVRMGISYGYQTKGVALREICIVIKIKELAQRFFRGALSL
jgi:hypothetical protein